jgi:hypothetical protein
MSELRCLANEGPPAYVETTIVSYLAALPSRDIVLAAHQQLTKDWWGTRVRFELFVCQAVVDEAGRGDAAVAARRIALVAGIPQLALGSEVDELANRLLQRNVVPGKSDD